MNAYLRNSLALLAACAALAATPAAGQIDVRPAATLPPAERAQVESRLHLKDFSLQQLQIPQGDVDTLVVEVRLMGADFALDLHRISFRAPDFQVLAPNEAGVLVPVTVGPPRTYEGAVHDWPDTLVSASLVAHGLRAIVWFDESNVWCIQPAAEAGLDAPGLHVVYKADDTLPTGHQCGNDDFAPPPPEEAAPAQPPGSAGPDQGYYKVEIAFDADHILYVLNNANLTQTVNDIESIAGGLNTIYRRDVEICLTVKSIIVRTTIQSEPYSSSNASTLLDQFTAHWQANHQGIGYDIAHLMTGRELDGSTIGVAWVGTVCDGSRYGLSQTRYSTNYNSRVGLTAHEIGHNFRAGHCNQSDTFCGYQPSDCRIMCSSAGGCSGNVTSFNSASIACIRDHRNTRSCVESCGCGQVYVVCPFPCFYTTVGFATTLAECGSTIRIQPRNYNEQLTIDKTLLFENASPGTPVLIGAP